MPDLPRVSQTFEADSGPYIDAIEAMITENRNLMDSIDDVIGKIGELKVALDSLPDEKNIKIELNEDDVLEQVAYIREVLDGIPDHKNVVVTVEQAGGATGGIKDTLTPDLGDTLEYTAEDVKRLNDMLGDTDTVAKAAGDAVVDAGSKADNALNNASNAAGLTTAGGASCSMTSSCGAVPSTPLTRRSSVRSPPGISSWTGYWKPLSPSPGRS